MRQPAKGPEGFRLQEDSPNVTFLMKEIKDRDPQIFIYYVEHLSLVFEKLKDIYFIIEEHDGSCYFGFEFQDGRRVPSWLLSGGTLQLIAMTLPAYLPKFRDILVIEEPENRLHPTNLDVIYQSLASVYEGQVLLTSHSPMFLGQFKPKQVCFFSKKSSRWQHAGSGRR